MARDYSRSKARRKRKPATRAKNQGLPGWVQLFVGLTMGLLVAAGVFIYYAPVKQQQPTLNQAAAPTEEPATDEDGLPPEEPNRFAFYEMLPNYELVIQYEEDGTAAGSKPKDKETKPKPKKPETPKQVDQPGKYIIQAGSFKSYEDADKRKAKLALLGLESEIERVTIDNTKTWYRVRLGPLNDINRVNGMLKRLRDNGIETLLMRHRG